MMNAAFKSLFVRHAMSSHAKQLALVDAVQNYGTWGVNVSEGTLALGDTIYQAGVLGSYNQMERSWLWGWANPNLNTVITFPDRVTAVHKQMQALGESNDIPLFRDAFTPSLDEDDCRLLAMVVVGLSPGCGGFYRAPNEHLSVFLLIQQPVPFDPSVRRIQRVITESIAQFPFPKGTHHDAVTSFFQSEGLDIQRSDPGEIFANGRDGTIEVIFGEDGCIRNVSSDVPLGSLLRP